MTNRTPENNNHILIVDYMYFFPFYQNTKYFINMSLEWMWKILWLQISSAHGINAKHIFLNVMMIQMKSQLHHQMKIYY